LTKDVLVVDGSTNQLGPQNIQDKAHRNTDKGSDVTVLYGHITICWAVTERTV